ncbi:MAG: threonylcarbamoyl-AMP synthase [Acetobacteraceae bacterium]|nr:threonylcarbamoyl-AMP synthase [Acetobacteraceae bacterium]
MNGLSQARTRVLKVDPGCPDPAVLHEAARVIRRGGLVAFPTETVYGLAAMGTSIPALKRLFKAKGRPQASPLTLHLWSTQQVPPLVRFIPDAARRLVARFWPGPLTLVLWKSRRVPAMVTGGRDSVGLRLPDHRVARELIRLAGAPLVAPSANLSGRPSPTSAADVLSDLEGRIDLVLDGGETSLGLESTVLDLTVDPPAVLRPGSVSASDIEACLGSGVRVGLGDMPDLRLRYAPGPRLLLFEGPDPAAVVGRILRAYRRLEAGGGRVGVLAAEESVPLYTAAGLPPGHVRAAGSRADPAAAARRLYRVMRGFEAEGFSCILAEPFPDEGLGAAVMHRLRLAAAETVKE